VSGRAGCGAAWEGTTVTAGMRPAPSGDTEALYVAQHERLYALCYAMLHDRADAEDAVQETFARVARRIDGLNGDPAGYLMVVARNVCRDELRRRLRRRTNLDFSTARMERPPEDAAVDRGLLRLVWRRLEAAERRLFVHAFSGLSLGEIAEQTGVSVDCAAQRMSRARRHARRLIGAPAALLMPLLKGEAFGRVVRRLANGRAHAGALFFRSDQAQQVIWPLLLGIVAATGVGPGPHDGAAPRPPIAAPVQVPAAPVASTTGAPVALRFAPALASPHLSSAPLRRAAPPPAAPPGIPPDPRASFSAFTPSPNYRNDHTIFGASGTYCSNPCATLWRSQDAGHTWLPLSYAILGSFKVLLPPTYPADPAIYAFSSQLGLQRSDNGGRTFRPVVPVAGGTAAVDPSSPAGNTRILLADQQWGAQMMLYSERDNTVVPLTTLPSDIVRIYSVFSGAGAAAVYVNAASLSDTAIYACSGIEPCRRVASAPVSTAPVVSPTFAVDRTYFTAQTMPNAVVIATLDGDSRTISLGDRTPVAILPAADYATSHRVDIITQEQDSSGRTLVSAVRALLTDATAPAATAVTQLMNFPSMTRLPDGRLVVGVATYSGPARSLLCSTDDGLSWDPTC